MDAVFHCCGGRECWFDCAASVLFRFTVPRIKLNLRRKGCGVLCRTGSLEVNVQKDEE